MGNLFVGGFDEPNQAEEFHLKLQKLQSEGLLDRNRTLPLRFDFKDRLNASLNWSSG
jgi:uncharacterized membrane protein